MGLARQAAWAADLFQGVPKSPRTRLHPLAPAAGTDAETQASCLALGCCWDAQPLAAEPWQPPVYMPACYFSNGGPSDYRVLPADAVERAEAGLVGNVTLLNQTSFMVGGVADLCVKGLREYQISLQVPCRPAPRVQLHLNGSCPRTRLRSAAPFNLSQNLAMGPDVNPLAASLDEAAPGASPLGLPRPRCPAAAAAAAVLA